MVIAVILPDEVVFGLSPIEEAIKYLSQRLPEVKFIVYRSDISFKGEISGVDIVWELLPHGFKSTISRLIWWNTSFKNQVKKYGISQVWSSKIYGGNIKSLRSFVFADDSFLKGKLLSLRQKLKGDRVGKMYSEEKFAAAERLEFKTQSAYIILPTIIPKALVSLKDHLISDSFFVCYASNATSEEMMQLLKAFSFFKKRMSSTTRLIIITENEGVEKTINNFDGYKHKADIQFIFTYTQTELQSLIGSSISFINFSQQMLSFFSLYYAINVGAAIIARETNHTKSVFDESLAYFNSQETLAAQMINMYKDENLRMFYKEQVGNLYQQRNININLMTNDALLAIH